jgi:uncharacterized protein DUF6286
MRTLNRALSVLLALALLTLGVVVVAEIIAAGLERRGHLLLPFESLARFGRDHTWSSGQVITISAAVALLGLLLLLGQLVPRRPGLLTVATEDPAVEAGVERRTLAKAMAAAATEVDGVSEAVARVRRGRATVIATSRLRDTSGLPERVQDHLQTWVDGLGLVAPPTLRLKLRRKET